jgi:hypothetical protein
MLHAPCNTKTDSKPASQGASPTGQQPAKLEQARRLNSDPCELNNSTGAREEGRGKGGRGKREEGRGKVKQKAGEGATYYRHHHDNTIVLSYTI